MKQPDSRTGRKRVGTITEDAGQPLLPRVLFGGAENGAGRRGDIEAMIDTGFDGVLTLQEATIRLGYPYSGSACGALAAVSEGQSTTTRVGPSGTASSVPWR